MTTITEIPTAFDRNRDVLFHIDGRRTYYAVSWPYGRGATTGDCPKVHAACRPIAFATKAERDWWVGLGATYLTESDYREAIKLDELPYGWSRADFVSSALYQNQRLTRPRLPSP